MDEFHHWVPSIPIVMYHGTPEQRNGIFKNQIMRHLHGGRPTEKFPVVCTSYEMVLKDRAALSRINWEFIIIVSVFPQAASVGQSLTQYRMRVIG